MKKFVAISLALVLGVLTLTGCQSSGTSDKTTGTTEAGAVDKSQQLIIYSNSQSEGRGEWLKERAAKEGFNVEVVGVPGGELTNRLIAEKNNSQADLVYGLNSLEYEKLKKEELLLKYEPDWAGEVDMTLGDKEGYYYPIVVQPLVLMYGKDYKDAPKDWTDLVDPKYKDRYTVLSLGGGTSKTVLSSILVRYQDPNGEYGISDEGWEVAKAYIQNAHIEVTGEDYVGDVVSGTRDMTMMWGSGVLQNQTERGFEFDIMTPEIGVPYVVEQVAIISGTKKAELAKEFANWFGSAEIQGEWSAKFGSIPAHPAAMEKTTDEVKGFMEKVKPQAIDWTFVADNVDMWVEKAELEFIQ